MKEKPWFFVIAVVLIMILAGTRQEPRGPGVFVSRAQGALSSPGMSLSPPARTTYESGTFRLDVEVDCGAHADAAAALVTFDPAYLQVVEVTGNASQFPHTLLSQYDNGTGHLVHDAGAALTCHEQGNCPSGMARMATITFRAVTGTVSTTSVDLQGQVTWEGAYVFDGMGSGATLAITLAGDMDGDCDVDIVDIMLVAGRWSSVTGDPNYDSRYDYDMDGDIDIVDIMFVAARWNQSCGVLP